MISNKHTLRLAKWIGLFCAIVSAGVLIMFTTHIAVSGSAKGTTTFILALMAVLSGLAGWAAVTGRALLLLALFFVTFVPVGLYLAALPSWLRIAGIAQLGFVVSSTMMFRAAKQARSGSE